MKQTFRAWAIDTVTEGFMKRPVSDEVRLYETREQARRDADKLRALFWPKAVARRVTVTVRG